MRDLTQTLFDANKTSIHFLNVEAETGLTFANIAAHSENAEKKARNQAHARIAYETILRFVSRVSLTAAEAETLASKVTRLKDGLAALGEAL